MGNLKWTILITTMSSWASFRLICKQFVNRREIELVAWTCERYYQSLIKSEAEITTINLSNSGATIEPAIFSIQYFQTTIFRCIYALKISLSNQKANWFANNIKQELLNLSVTQHREYDIRNWSPVTHGFGSKISPNRHAN